MAIKRYNFTLGPNQVIAQDLRTLKRIKSIRFVFKYVYSEPFVADSGVGYNFSIYGIGGEAIVPQSLNPIPITEDFGVHEFSFKFNNQVLDSFSIQTFDDLGAGNPQLSAYVEIELEDFGVGNGRR